MADQKRLLIIGETPERNDFSDPAIPKGTTPEKIRDGHPNAVERMDGDSATGQPEIRT